MYGCNYTRACCVCADRDGEEGGAANGTAANGDGNVVVHDQVWRPVESVNAEMATDLPAVRRRTRLNWNVVSD